MNEIDLRAMWDAMTPDERAALSARVSGAVDGLRGQVLAIVDRANADYAAGRFDPREVAWINAEDHIGDAPKMVPPPAEAVTDPHPLTDEQIAQFWPDMDTPEKRAEIRRQFDTLIASCHPSAERDALRAEVTKLEGERIDLIAESDRLREELKEARAARQAADHDLVDRFRNTKTGRFTFPDDVAAIIVALDEARAETGALIERAAALCDEGRQVSHGMTRMKTREECRDAIRALTPADATAAQAARDRATREGCATLVGRWRDMIREMELFEHFLDRLPDIIREGNPFTFSATVAATITEPTADEQAELDRMTVGYLRDGRS